MPNIGPLEIAIVLILVLVVFGPKKLPEMGRGLGRGMREFKAGITGKGGESEAPAEIPAPATEAVDAVPVQEPVAAAGAAVAPNGAEAPRAQ